MNQLDLTVLSGLDVIQATHFLAAVREAGIGRYRDAVLIEVIRTHQLVVEGAQLAVILRVIPGGVPVVADGDRQAVHQLLLYLGRQIPVAVAQPVQHIRIPLGSVRVVLPEVRVADLAALPVRAKVPEVAVGDVVRVSVVPGAGRGCDRPNERVIQLGNLVVDLGHEVP